MTQKKFSLRQYDENTSYISIRLSCSRNDLLRRMGVLSFEEEANEDLCQNGAEMMESCYSLTRSDNARLSHLHK